MGRKSKETLAKEAKTLELNQKRFASFFKPKTSTVAKQPLKESSPNTNRINEFDESLKPVKNSTCVASVPSLPVPSKKDFTVFKDQNDVEPVDLIVHDTIAAVDQVDPVDPIAPVVAVADFRYANQLIQVTPGDVYLFDLPQGMFLHEAIEGDGACLFRSVSFAISESQNLYIIYRQQALEYISTHADMFEADIEQMSGRTVAQYVAYMSPDFIFADQIMVIALCLYLNVSITLFQKGLETIDSCTFAPVHGNATKQLNIYLDLYAAHYDCIVSSPLAAEQAAFSVKSFLPKQIQTTASAMLSASQEIEVPQNISFGRNSIQALEIAPESSAPSLKRKAATIVVSDDEDDLPVAGPSNATAQSLPEILLSLKMTKDNKVAIPASVWKRVQKDASITVRQFSRAGFREVDKTATHLPDSGRKQNGENSMRPILSFMVKAFKDNFLLLSGNSVSTAKNTQEISNPNRGEKHERIKEAAAKITDPALKKQKMMESTIFAGSQKKSEKHQSVKEEAAKISDPELKKAKLMESAIFANNQKIAETVSTPGNVKEFLEKTAESLRGRSPNFEPNNANDIEKSKDFIAILFSNGHVTAADVVTPLVNRDVLIEDIKTNPKSTVHTGLPALFHRSSTFDMVSPDRSVFIQLDNGSYVCPDYLDERQITVLASHFSQRFFNATPYRSRLLNKIIGFYLRPISMKLEFDSRFDYMDNRLAMFLSCETAEKRRAIAGKFPQTKSNIIRRKIQLIFSNMKSGNPDPRIKKEKEIVCDFAEWQEVDDLFRIFEYRCVVTGIKWAEGFVISIDKFVTSGSRYNWFDCLPMLWRLNDAKNAERKTFETRESLQAYMEANEMADLHPLQGLVKIMRVQFVALVSHSFKLYGFNPQQQEPFDDSLKAHWS